MGRISSDSEGVFHWVFAATARFYEMVPDLIDDEVAHSTVDVPALLIPWTVIGARKRRRC